MRFTSPVNMRRKHKKLICRIAMPIIFTGIAVGIYVLAAHQAWDLAYSKWKTAIIKGAPEYTYESMLNMSQQASEGSLYYGEVRLPEEGARFGEVVCEKIDLEAPLYCGDSEEILEQGAGVYAAGSMPGEKGVILTGAHDTTFFAPLEQIEVSDIITVKTVYGVFEYQVSKTEIVNIKRQKPELTSTEEKLLLYTCYPFGETGKVRTKRYLVWADKISGPEIKEAE